jgi:hypothetical protein
MVFVVRTVFQVCAVEKVFPTTCTIAGVKIAWRPVRNGSWEIQPEKLTKNAEEIAQKKS